MLHNSNIHGGGVDLHPYKLWLYFVACVLFFHAASEFQPVVDPKKTFALTREKALWMCWWRGEGGAKGSKFLAFGVAQNNAQEDKIVRRKHKLL